MSKDIQGKECANPNQKFVNAYNAERILIALESLLFYGRALLSDFTENHEKAEVLAFHAAVDDLDIKRLDATSTEVKTARTQGTLPARTLTDTSRP